MFTTLQIRKRTRKKHVGKTNPQGRETSFQMTRSSVVVLSWVALICVEPNSSYFCGCFSLQSITCQSSAFSLPLDCHHYLRAPAFPHRRARMFGVSSLLLQGRSHWRDTAKPQCQTMQNSHCSLVMGWYFVLGVSNSVECGVAQVIWFLFFLLPWCLCQSLLNMQEPYSEEQVSPPSNAELSSHWCWNAIAHVRKSDLYTFGHI